MYAAANPYSNLIVAFARADGGSLAPLAGRAGCVAVGSPRCEPPIYRQRELSALAVSPDGHNLYAAADYKYVQAVQAFGRDGRGGLRNAHHGITCAGAHGPLRGTDGQNRCGLATALGSPSDLVAGPGGRELYAAAANHLTILHRTETGGVHATGCIGSPGERLRGVRCTPARAMTWATAVAPAPDGRNVYVASSEGVAVLARDVDDGTLTQLPGSAGCVTQVRTPGCATGRSVGRTWEPSTARSGGTQVAVSPDGHNVYVAGRYGIAAFARDRRTGALTQLPGRSGCIAEGPHAGCTPGRALRNIEGLVVSSDGASVYGAAFVSRAVAVLRRTASGALRQAAGPGGCIAGEGGHGCSRARAVGAPTAIAISPDATTVYVASREGGLAVFARVKR